MQGETGARGRIGVLENWTLYREFWFDGSDTALDDSDEAKVPDMAKYMKNNPSLLLGIDGSLDSKNDTPENRDRCDRRVKSVADALIAAGVPENNIKYGAFGDYKLRRNGRVEVLLITSGQEDNRSASSDRRRFRE